MGGEVWLSVGIDARWLRVFRLSVNFDGGVQCRIQHLTECGGRSSVRVDTGWEAMDGVSWLSVKTGTRWTAGSSLASISTDAIVRLSVEGDTGWEPVDGEVEDAIVRFSVEGDTEWEPVDGEVEVQSGVGTNTRQIAVVGFSVDFDRRLSVKVDTRWEPVDGEVEVQSGVGNNTRQIAVAEFSVEFDSKRRWSSVEVDARWIAMVGSGVEMDTGWGRLSIEFDTRCRWPSVEFDVRCMAVAGSSGGFDKLARKVAGGVTDGTIRRQAEVIEGRI
ncbi:hypothetical protein BKA70DRAFT_1215853 [Coprinopsis sp. MPI-PUGE-AT-0042]|nr:hypothetical protein BKA70DRAFT_1215853 [Coprinopsis sp. MPI-PUGE-AT-0042]